MRSAFLMLAIILTLSACTTMPTPPARETASLASVAACSNDEAYWLGRRGVRFGECSISTKEARLHYVGGLAIYCQRENGYAVGAAGEKYEGVCPKSKEVGFLAAFIRGRANYLNAAIASNENEIDDLETSLALLERAQQTTPAQPRIDAANARQDFLRRANRDMRVELTTLTN